MLALLLGNPVNVNLQGSEFGTGLQAATFLGQTEMVSLLLELGANVNAGNRSLKRREGRRRRRRRWCGLRGEY